MKLTYGEVCNLFPSRSAKSRQYMMDLQELSQSTDCKTLSLNDIIDEIANVENSTTIAVDRSLRRLLSTARESESIKGLLDLSGLQGVSVQEVTLSTLVTIFRILDTI